MAPASAAQSLQGHRPRPSTSKPIVPVIPLHYMQKRKQNVPATPKKVEEDKALTPATPTPTPSSPVAAQSAPKSPEASPKPVSISEEEALSTPATTATSIVEDSPEQTQVGEQNFREPVKEDDTQQTPHLVSSDVHSTESKSTYNMPPPFVPASNYTNTDINKQRSESIFVGQHPMHQPHPSNGSLVFGAYAESNNSSPAPPPTGSIPQYPPQDTGRVQPPQFTNGHISQPPNGFSPMGPPPGFRPFPAHEGPEGYARRQLTTYGPTDSYSPTGAHPGVEWSRYAPQDLSTSHSFHGSQSSVPNEQDGLGPQFHSHYNNTAAILSGPSGHAEDVRLYQHRPKPRRGSGVAGNQGHHHTQSSFVQPQFSNGGDDFDGLIGYLQTQFGNPQFSDYTLELRYSDDRATPVRLQGHNLLFARSPTLKSLMTAQVQESGGDSLSLRTLFIESDDRFLRSDAFHMAVQRLYGAPLLHPGVPPSIGTPSGPLNNIPGTPFERFDLALGYAAAGHLLQMPPVIHRGIDIACTLISMQTVERSFDFALDGGLHPEWITDHSQIGYGQPTYGPEVNHLLHSALHFIITSFPPNFELNTAAPDFTTNRRLPVIPDSHPAAHSRFSGLQFGDHTLDDSSSPHISVDPHTPVSIISKILINLPFALLKFVLESPRLGNVSGWATATLRQKAMYAVVEEREKRRLKVFESKTMSDAQRQSIMKDSEAIGWKESVGPVGATADTCITREWVGIVPSGN